MPVTRPPGPAARAAGIVTAPLPQPISSTIAPGAIPAWATRCSPICWKNSVPVLSYAAAAAANPSATRCVTSGPVCGTCLLIG